MTRSLPMFSLKLKKKKQTNLVSVHIRCVSAHQFSIFPKKKKVKKNFNNKLLSEISDKNSKYYKNAWYGSIEPFNGYLQKCKCRFFANQIWRMTVGLADEWRTKLFGKMFLMGESPIDSQSKYFVSFNRRKLHLSFIVEICWHF